MSRSIYEPDLDPVLEPLHPRFKKALELAYAQLQRKHVPAALIGGLAVAAYGHIRNTKDIDFLVDFDAAFEGSAVISLREGMPIKAEGLTIDLLPAEESWLRKALDQAVPDVALGIPVLPLTALIAMKLLAWRPKDQADVLGLIDWYDETGPLVGDVQAYLEKNGLTRARTRLDQLLY